MKKIKMMFLTVLLLLSLSTAAMAYDFSYSYYGYYSGTESLNCTISMTQDYTSFYYNCNVSFNNFSDTYGVKMDGGYNMQIQLSDYYFSLLMTGGPVVYTFPEGVYSVYFNNLKYTYDMYSYYYTVTGGITLNGTYFDMSQYYLDALTYFLFL